MNQIIQIDELKNTKVELVESAEIIKADLLTKVSTIATVNATNYESAAEILRDLTKTIKEVEDARTLVKKPVLELGRRIDTLAKNYNIELETEKRRLSAEIGKYIAAEERKAREEAERLAREEAEKQAKLKAEAEAAKVKSEENFDFEAAFEAEEKSKAVENIVTTPIQVKPAVKKISNTRTITTRKFKVTDPEALMKVYPRLFMPDESAIRSFVKYNVKDIHIKIPGLEIWEETTTSAY